MAQPPALAVAIAAMVAVVAGSNFAVQFPINEWLTWGRSPTRFRFWLPT